MTIDDNDCAAKSELVDRPDPSLLDELFAADAHLFPLTAYDDESRDLRSRGKRPWRRGWNRPDAKPLTKREAKEHMGAGRNIGDRLKPTDLVIDIDPRNFGGGDDYTDPDVAEIAANAALDAWCAEHGFDCIGWPVYVTGSGGLHVRLKKQADLRIVSKLPDRPGFEFKTAGTFVVAPGSVHARTGRRYERCGLNSVYLKDAPEAPEKLLDMLREPEVQPGACDALAYRREGVDLGNGIKAPRVALDGVVTGSADAPMRPKRSKSPKLNAAVDFLRDALSTGPVSAGLILRRGRKAGHAEKTVRRAKARLGVESQRRDNEWFWHLET